MRIDGTGCFPIRLLGGLIEQDVLLLECYEDRLN